VTTTEIQTAVYLIDAVHRTKEPTNLVARHFNVPESFVALVRRQTDASGILDVDDTLLEAVREIVDGPDDQDQD
jgi:hypothetical protein